MQKDEEVDFFREKFAGSQADRIVKAEADAKKISDKLKEAKISGYTHCCRCVCSGPTLALILSYDALVRGAS